MQKINLFVNYYQCGSIERQKEIDFCFNHNSKSGYFDNVINFSDRPTYTDFFNETLNYPNDINVFANSDIYFTDTIFNVRELGKRQSYAITRWELEGDNIVSFDEKHSYNKEAKAMHSQDVWVFNGSVVGVYGQFHLGVAGCDNRIAYEISKAGYLISNPYDKIKCIHKHKEEIRNYNVPKGYSNGKVPPPYKWVGNDNIKTRKRI